MTVQTLPATGAFSYAPGTTHNSDVSARFEAWLAFTRAMLGGGDEKTYVVASASIAPDSASCIVDLPSGTPTGNLDAIATTNLPLGFVLFLRSADPSRIPTVRNGRGTAAQFLSADGSDRVLTSTSMLLVVQRKTNGWRELLWYPGSGVASWQSFLGISWAQSVAGLATQTQAIAGTDATRLVTALTNRQAQVDPSWMAALPTASTAAAANALLLYDGTALWRVATQTALLGAPYKPFTQAGVVIGVGTSGSYAHGLGAKPRIVTGEIVCTTDDGGWSAANGDSLPVGSIGDSIMLYKNATVVGFSCASSGGISVQGPGGGRFSIAPANWRMTIRAWA